MHNIYILYIYMTIDNFPPVLIHLSSFANTASPI